MVRFTADVDSPSPPPPVTKPTSISTKPKEPPLHPLSWSKRKRQSSSAESLVAVKPEPDLLRSHTSELVSPVSTIRQRTGPPKSRIRRFKVDSVSSNTRSSSWGSPRKRTQKTWTRCTVEVTLLLSIGISLAYFAIRDMPTKPDCDTAIPELLRRELDAKLQEQIFRQDAAIQNLTFLLKSHTGVSTLSLVGGSGTGKSLTAKILSDVVYKGEFFRTYHWPEVVGETHRRHVDELKYLILSTPLCQPELLVVDNLSGKQKPYIEELNRWMESSSRLHQRNLVILFIFNFEDYGNGKSEEDQDVEEEHFLGELEKTNVIYFRSFKKTDAMDYLIQKRSKGAEREREESSLDKELLELIVENANVGQFGFKRLANKF